MTETIEKKTFIKPMGLKSLLTIVEVMSFDDLIDRLKNGWLVAISLECGNHVAFLKLEDNDIVRLYSDDGKKTNMTITRDMTVFGNKYTDVYAFKKEASCENIHLFNSVAMVAFISKVAGLPVMTD